jgi:hypothetical protein
MSNPFKSRRNVADGRTWRSLAIPFATVLTLLAGYSLSGDVSTVAAGVAVAASAGIVPAVDVPATQFANIDGGRRGAQAARIELDDTNLDHALSAWYRLAYIDGGTRLQVFEHYTRNTLGPGTDIALSQGTAWILANQAVGPYGASTTAGDIPDWARVRTGNNTGPSAGLIFTLSYIDLLTPGPLLGDLHVAGTGGIGDDGVVFPVSNVEVKVAAALLAHPDVVFTPRPSTLIEHTTIIESQHTRIVADGSTVGEWLNVTGYEQAGRDAANHPGTTAYVVVHDYRQALAFLCGRTNNPTTCNIAQRAASLPITTP